MALVRPPCGWSTGFIATPRTWFLQPYERQWPLFVFESLRFNLRAAGPNIIVPYMEKNFRTPEGNFTNARWVERSSFMIFADVPALMAYWAPLPGHNSTFESFRNFGAERIKDMDENLFSFDIMGRRGLNVKNEKARVVSNAGTYELEPEGKSTKARSLLENGTNCKVEITPGTTDRKVVLSLNNRIRRKVLPFDLIITWPVRLDLPARHFLRNDRDLNLDWDNHNALKVFMLRDALEVTALLRKIKISLIWVLTCIYPTRGSLNNTSKTLIRYRHFISLNEFSTKRLIVISNWGDRSGLELEGK